MKKSFMLYALLLLLLLTACGTNINVPTVVDESVIDYSQHDEVSSTPQEEKISPVVEHNNNVATPSPSGTPITTTQTDPDDYDYILEFPSDNYPETALHIFSAIENGHSDVCTIDREGADENRKKSLAGIDTMKGYDRDEWPMAMCAEGGEGASVAYIDPSDNRGAGSWVGHQLSAYNNGEKVLFIVSKPKNLFGKNVNDQLNIDEDLVTPSIPDKPKSTDKESVPTSTPSNIVYKNCTEVREAGAAPIMMGDPGYSKKLDRDGDGIACEVK